MANGEGARIALWAFYSATLLINFIYVILSFATADSLGKAASKLNIGLDDKVWHAPLAACGIGGTMVLVFNIMTCVILIRKTVNKAGPGFGYGFIMSWCFVLIFFTLLCGLILQGFYDTVDDTLRTQTDKWSSYRSGGYRATYVFAYLNMAMFSIFFLCLVIFQVGIMKQVKMNG